MNKSIYLVALAVIFFYNCSGNTSKQQTENESDPEMHHNEDGEGQQGGDSSAVLEAYLTLKDALVDGNQEAAAKAGATLASSIGSFSLSTFKEADQQELSEIVETAKEHGEHIAKSDIGHQREHFEMLSKDMVDLVAIVGTDKTLYQQYCPMYNNNKGGMWLSAKKEIRNPYFGDKMLACGSVQKEIN
ncbi:DUF3347 domain-containing protein [Parapedobacter tibetensis]|uniref:DUF3347 domain-containing protein n=1 Tax=Parapedobacter tibetensis TaxID=2972951 RepID=UPI00214D9AD4|nr:DUF3347 domain-containing protein [Parapedobacter tibetensis]